ncbi:tail fiber domain-containing protein [Flavobacteriaceae bacterium]|nr:tail fiber domain-containing protein [Flavobacteriaceae bacterium]
MNQKAEKILKLQPKQFNYKKNSQKTQFGFLAQEVEKIYPELVHQVSGNDSLKSIDYFGLIPLLVQVIQQQQLEINQLKKKIQN